MAGVEYDAVPSFERALKPKVHLVAVNVCDLAQINAALFSKTRMNQSLVIDAVEPARGKAARKSHFHFVFGLLAGGSSLVSHGVGQTIQSIAINSSDVGNVFG